ncbi:MAG TPA: hypothetical protein DC014_03290 [Treponema sp.]|jgi:membrane protein implicated in regulation of membrane protease activity|nr:hypothetical protein [Treponema sp.]
MIDFFLQHLPVFWLVVMAVCIVIESMTMMLTTIWFGCGALVMVFVSMTPLPFKWQLLLFVAISLALLIFTRPFVYKKLKLKKQATNADSLIGKKVIVTQTISALEKGAIKINGIEWTASCANLSDSSQSISPGTEVTVTDIQGATAIVSL